MISCRKFSVCTIKPYQHKFLILVSLIHYISPNTTNTFLRSTLLLCAICYCVFVREKCESRWNVLQNSCKYLIKLAEIVGLFISYIIGQENRIPGAWNCVDIYYFYNFPLLMDCKCLDEIIKKAALLSIIAPLVNKTGLDTSDPVPSILARCSLYGNMSYLVYIHTGKH